MDEAVDFEASTELVEHQKVALRAHTAFLTHPAGLDDGLRASLLEHFTPPQIVELAFKYLWWSSNRPVATLGVDAPHRADRLTTFHFGEQGEYIVHE